MPPFCINKRQSAITVWRGGIVNEKSTLFLVPSRLYLSGRHPLRIFALAFDHKELELRILSGARRLPSGLPEVSSYFFIHKVYSSREEAHVAKDPILGEIQMQCHSICRVTCPHTKAAVQPIADEELPEKAWLCTG